jgi:HK97 family phage prohead protease
VNVLQLGTDFLQPGAFRDTLKGEIPLCFNHERDHPIGHCQPREAVNGDIEISGTFFLDDTQQRHADVLALLRGGMIRGLSICFELDDYDDLPHGQRVIRRGTLLEASLVEKGGNPHAVIQHIAYWPANPQEHQAFWQQRRRQ